MHNTHQAKTNEKFTQNNKDIYEALSLTNVKALSGSLNNGAFKIYHDGQVVGVSEHADNSAGWAWRVHTALRPDLIEDPESEQHKVWNYLKEKMSDENGNIEVDFVQIHPSREPVIDEFLPRGGDALDEDKVVYRPAAASRIGGGTKELTPKDMEFYWTWFNSWLVEHGQAPLDPNRPVFVLEARFDESKDQPAALEVHKLFTEEMNAANVPLSRRPQTVIVGESSDDDPSGEKIEKQINDRVAIPEFDGLRDDIKVARLPNIEQVRNALKRRDPVGENGKKRNVVAFQPSLEEGCEVNVSQDREKGVPVIGSNTGGIPRQIIDGVTGYVVEPGDYEGMARLAYGLFMDDEKYEEMSKAAGENRDSTYTTMADLVDWMGLVALKKNGRFDTLMREQREMLGRQPFARELILAEYGHVLEEPKKQVEQLPQKADVFVVSGELSQPFV